MRECLVRSTVPVGGGRSPLSLANCCMNKRTILMLFVWTPAAAFASFGLLRVGATALMGLIMGGPFEAPPGMSVDEFMRWTSSGAWWKEAVFSGGLLIAIPVAIAVAVTIATRGPRRHYSG